MFNNKFRNNKNRIQMIKDINNNQNIKPMLIYNKNLFLILKEIIITQIRVNLIKYPNNSQFKTKFKKIII